MVSGDTAELRVVGAEKSLLPTKQYAIKEYHHEYQLPFSKEKRRIALLLRSLWGRGFSLESHSATLPPRLREGMLCFPEHLRCLEPAYGVALYRAMALHMAAHLTYTRNWSHCGSSFTPIQRHLIELVEDARVEQNTIHYYPGFKKLWSDFITAFTLHPALHPAEQLLKQIPRILLDKHSDIEIEDEEISAWGKRFHQSILFNRNNSSLSVHLGMELHNILATRKVLEGLEQIRLKRLPYRDDGLFLWGGE